MKIQRDGKEYTLTAEEVMEAHEEFVTSFMAAELENSYDVPHKYSKDLAKEAYDMYADSGNYSEYDCIERVAKDYQDRCKEPTVTITWSECNDFEDGEVIPLAEANKRFELIDADIREQYGGHYYEKTKFLLNYNMGKENFSYEGRQDFGDYEVPRSITFIIWHLCMHMILSIMIRWHPVIHRNLQRKSVPMDCFF